MSMSEEMRAIHASRTRLMFLVRGAILENTHVVYTNPKPEGDGDHGSVYFAKDRMTPHVADLDLMSQFICTWTWAEAVVPETVVSVATGGIAFGQSVARELVAGGRVRKIAAVFAEKAGDDFVFRREYDRLVADRDVLVVEDIVNSRGSVLRVIDLVRRTGGRVAGVACMVDRSGGATAADLHVPKFHALLATKEQKYPRTACGLCRQVVPINTAVGKGDAFLRRYPEMRHLAPSGWVG